MVGLLQFQVSQCQPVGHVRPTAASEVADHIHHVAIGLGGQEAVIGSAGAGGTGIVRSGSGVPDHPAAAERHQAHLIVPGNERIRELGRRTLDRGKLTRHGTGTVDHQYHAGLLAGSHGAGRHRGSTLPENPHKQERHIDCRRDRDLVHDERLGERDTRLKIASAPETGREVRVQKLPGDLRGIGGGAEQPSRAQRGPVHGAREFRLHYVQPAPVDCQADQRNQQRRQHGRE